MFNRTKRFIGAAVLVAAAGLGVTTLSACGNDAGGTSSSQSIAGTYVVDSYNDGSMSYDHDGLKKVGYDSTLVVNDNGTLELDGFPGTWVEKDGIYTFTVTNNTPEQSGGDESEEVVFTAKPVAGGGLVLDTKGVEWTYIPGTAAAQS